MLKIVLKSQYKEMFHARASILDKSMSEKF